MPGNGFIDRLTQRLSRFKQMTGASDDILSSSTRYSDQDIAYMQSLAAAVVQREPKFMRLVLGLSVLVLLMFVIGMGIFELDITVRGDGKVIPSQQIQHIQSLEGGIVSEILVKEGEQVMVNAPLMRISDITFSSSFEENRQRYLMLNAKIARLRAESGESDFVDNSEVLEQKPELMSAERSLYETHKRQFEQGQQILEEQVLQAESELTELEARKKQLGRSVDLIQQEIDIKKPLVKKQLVSEVEYLQLKRQASELDGELEGVSLAIPRLNSRISEARRKLEESKLNFQNDAKLELSEALGEVAQLTETQMALSDRVRRTLLRSPVSGTVKRIYNNTIGGVIRPGSDVVEVVPNEDALLVEARIKPSDIANISVGQKARVIFSAYDFAIYGSLSGVVHFISADTITNERDETYYVVRILPERDYLGSAINSLPIKVGMTTQVDVLTGKRTILRYLLKPITRGLHNAMQEQ
ncbi:MAG: HlyD family type I secretion periplasmic adaptor subunit [Chromatiales bacterium]|nr:HlyD family type I secretion periplasmic adaptor subunit [Chromatiales bacterium]